MRRPLMAAGVVCVALVGASVGATESTTVFERLVQLDTTAANGQQEAERIAGHVAALDAELDSRWATLDVSTRAALPIRQNVTQGLGRWLAAHRRAEREAFEGPHAGADTRQLLRYAAPRALAGRLVDADVVRRADNERAGFVDAMARRANWSVELARTAARAQAAGGSRDVLIAEARAGGADADLGATADELEAVLAGLAPVERKVDFHRLKGTLARPITMPPTHAFGESAPLVRANGWTYRAANGTEVHAIGDGEVVYRGVVQGFGLVVVIAHGAGYHSALAHLGDASVDVGDEVRRAEVVATVGESGSLDGPRLFFQLRRDGEPVDPKGWFLKQ